MSIAGAVRTLEAARSEYLKAVRASDLAHVEGFFRRFLRPTVFIATGSEVTTEMSCGRSRFGGAPDLPRGSAWPTHAYGAYRFFAQFNLEELPLLPQSAVLPEDGSNEVPAFFHSKGLLSLFVADTPDCSVFWQDDGYVKAVYTPPELFPELVPTEAPAGAPFAEYHPKHCLPLTGFTLGCQPPFRQECTHPSSAWPLSEEETDSYVYEELIDTLRTTDNYLLGYPSYCSLGYDPTPEPYKDYVHLLGLTSIEALNWCWHDGDRLSVFIKRDDLLRGDFSSLKCDAG